MDKENSKRIVFFCGNISKSGGTESALSKIANGLSVRGHMVFVICLMGNGEPFFELNKEITVYPVNSKTLKSDVCGTIKKLRVITSEIKPDVWIDVDSILIFYSRLMKKYCHDNTKFISWEHFSHDYIFDTNSLIRRISKRLVLNSNNILAVITKEDELYYQGIVKDKTRIIRIPNTYGSIGDYDFEDKEKQVIFVGHLTKNKGVDLLLYIWKQVENNNPDWILRIIGEGEEREHLEALKDSLCLSNVFFEGTENKVNTIYEKASILVLTSYKEYFPLVILEAFASKTAVVSYDCGDGVKELITDNANGFLIPQGEIMTFADAVNSLIKDKEKRLAVTKNALNNLEMYSYKNVLDLWEDII